MPTAPRDVMHTPTPWRIERRHSADVRIAADNCTICMMANWLPAEIAERDANATLIVEAVNAHDTLRAENARLLTLLADVRPYIEAAVDSARDKSLWAVRKRAEAVLDLITNALKDPQP